MASIRAFIAIETPAEVRKKISVVQEECKKTQADVRWESEDKFHATVKFLGNVDEKLLPAISKKIGTAVRTYLPCEVIF